MSVYTQARHNGQRTLPRRDRFGVLGCVGGLLGGLRRGTREELPACEGARDTGAPCEGARDTGAPCEGAREERMAKGWATARRGASRYFLCLCHTLAVTALCWPPHFSSQLQRCVRALGRGSGFMGTGQHDSEYADDMGRW